MSKVLKVIGAILGLVIILWVAWANVGYAVAENEGPKDSISYKVLEKDSISGSNVIVVQPYMDQIDYASQKHFQSKIESYLAAAYDNAAITEKSVVLFPEYMSTWLVAANEKRSAIKAKTLTAAMAQIILASPFEFLKYFKTASEKDKVAASIFRSKADGMKDIFQSTFSFLAQKYGVDIVAGSIILPDPSIENGQIKLNVEGPLYNNCFTFLRNGEVHPTIIQKVFPTSEEAIFVESAKIENLSAIDLPVGKIGNVVCADSWYPEVYDQYSDQGLDILLVNSYCGGNSTMSKPWNGYNGSEAPNGVDLKDIQKITEEDAWLKYAMAGRIGALDSIPAVTTFLNGNLWDLGSDGKAILFDGKEIFRTQNANKGHVLNFKI